MTVTLRPLSRADFPVLGGWLREPLVAEWWHDDADAAALERQYGPALDGRDRTRLRLALEGGRPAGFIQWYPLDDEPDYLAELRPWVDVPPGAWSLDYLVGEPELRGRGLGTAMIAAALAELGPHHLVVPVHARNSASRRILEHNGFTVHGPAELEPDNPTHTRDHLVLTRAA